MTEAVADLKAIYADELSVAWYTSLRTAALTTDANAKQLEEVIKEFKPSGTTEHAKKGIAWWILGRAQKAIGLLQEAHPQEQLASIFLGKAWLDLDEPAKAKMVYREALAETPDSRPLAYGTIFATLRLGELDEALSILDRAEERFEVNRETIFLRGFHSELSGEYGDARTAYEKVLEEAPQHSHALFRLAHWHQTWGDEQEAITLYERTRQLKPTFTNALLNLGNLYEDYQKYEEAAQCYREVLDAIPNHPRATMFMMDARASKTMYYDEEGERRADRQSAILKIPVTDFELSVRSRNCLNKMNVKTLGDLIQMTEQDLLAHKNFGETSLIEVKQMLAQKGLRLGQGKIEGGTLHVPSKPVTVSDEVLGQHIDTLKLSVRSRKCMERLGIATIGQLLNKTEAELLSAKNFGQTSLNEIKACLDERGLRLKDSPY